MIEVMWLALAILLLTVATFVGFATWYVYCLTKGILALMVSKIQNVNQEMADRKEVKDAARKHMDEFTRAAEELVKQKGMEIDRIKRTEPIV